MKSTAQPNASLPYLNGDYSLTGGVFDEMWVEKGQMRPVWKRFLEKAELLGHGELHRARLEAKRLLRENGVTYNVYGQPGGLNRPWELDPVPYLIEPSDWAKVDKGLRQRAQVLDLLFKDIYGPRLLVKNGLLPAELLFHHPGFLRACANSLQAGSRQLLLYGADLTRGPDGRIWVLNDRTQAPSGAGYALESRVAMARVVPDLFRDLQVRRLASFFNTLRSSLTHFAPNTNGEPRVVVLTPGPLNETYFEQAYLAAYLGYTLVQGDDLTVRDSKVWMKSLDGMRQVDVILRRVDDNWCDPLELRQDSQLGVAGLLHAVRAGSVVIANPLGSGVLENRGLMPFLPQITRFFLDEELILPTAATWWCGQKSERDYVLANLNKLVLKTIDRSPGTLKSVQGWELSAQEQSVWRHRILVKPHLFVGQEPVLYSTTPALISGNLQPRHAVVRCFAAATETDYVVMPGGLTRAAQEASTQLVSNQNGGINKDTWILADQPQPPARVWPQPSGSRELVASATVIPSRAAENLFWVGRYAERSEMTARLLRTGVIRLREAEDTRDESDQRCAKHMLRTITSVTATYPGFIGGEPNPRTELLAMASDVSRVGSLASSLQALARSAFSVRDLWSNDAWRVIDDLEDATSDLQLTRPSLSRLHSKLDQLLIGLVAFSGLNMESMTQEHSWLMLDCGRRIERALMLIAFLRATVVSPEVDETAFHLILESVLTTCDSIMTHRRRYRSYLQLSSVLEVLLLDEKNPRSLAYQLNRLQSHLPKLPRDATVRITRAEKMILDAMTSVRLAEPTELCKPQATLSKRVFHKNLDELISHVHDCLLKSSDALGETYFSHTQWTQQWITSRMDATE